MDRQYVGIDFHRRRSVIVRLSAAGVKLSSVRVANDPVAIAAAVAEAWPNGEGRGRRGANAQRERRRPAGTRRLPAVGGTRTRRSPRALGDAVPCARPGA
jgi:hypothetical protein